MRRIIGYSAELRSKYNHQTMNSTNNCSTYVEAKRKGELLLSKEKFGNEMYLQMCQLVWEDIK